MFFYKRHSSVIESPVYPLVLNLTDDQRELHLNWCLINIKLLASSHFCE